jgi:hypothetical protein
MFITIKYYYLLDNFILIFQYTSYLQNASLESYEKFILKNHDLIGNSNNSTEISRLIAGIQPATDNVDLVTYAQVLQK